MGICVRLVKRTFWWLVIEFAVPDPITLMLLCWAGRSRDLRRDEMDPLDSVRDLRQSTRRRTGGLIPLRFLQTSSGGENVLAHTRRAG